VAERLDANNWLGLTCQPGNLARERGIVKDWRTLRRACSLRQLAQQTRTARATSASRFTAATASARKNVNFRQLNQTRSTPVADI
jgi:hypothetical protein